MASPSTALQSLAKVPDFVRDPELHLFEIQSAYQQMRVEAPKMRQRLAQLTEPSSSDAIQPLSLPTPITGLLIRYRAAYGILPTLASTFNGILRAFDPDDVDLVKESASYSNDIMTLAADMSQYRPLGASYIPLCLIAAWAATEDPSKQAEVEKMLAEYQADFVEARWMQCAIWLKNKFEILRHKVCTSHLDNPHDSGYTAAKAPSGELVEAMGAGTSCCIL
jgi:hypothetical protein